MTAQTDAHKSTVHLSHHARRRQQQRGVSSHHIDAALRWGHHYQQGRGREVYFLGSRHAELARRHGEDVERFVGTAVVVGADGGIITVIRTASPSRIRKGAR